jgi:ubiquitin-protein ligase
MRRLMRELVELKNSPPEGIRVVTSEDNMLDVTGIIEGPGEYIYRIVQLWTEVDTCLLFRGHALCWGILSRQV